MRERILSLPLMAAAVVTLLWKQVPSVNELTRQLNRKDLLWAKAVSVSRQAVSERFLTLWLTWLLLKIETLASLKPSVSRPR